MLKISGAVLVIGASFLVGLSFARRLTERCRLLKTWVSVLEILKTEIYYQNNLLPAVFQRVGRFSTESVFKREFQNLADMVEFGSEVDFMEAWLNAVTQTGSNNLTQNDYAILSELGNYLGSTDRTDQCERIKVCQARLQNNIELAESERNQKQNLYRYLGFAVGAVIVLFLF